MLAFSLFPGDSVVLIALLSLLVATFAGSMLGGVRMGMLLGSSLVSWFASGYFAEFNAFNSLSDSLGFDYPAWRLMVPRLVAFLSFLVILVTICEVLHKQVVIHYKYKNKDDDTYFNTWNYLNSVWGLALGILMGVVYLVGFFANLHPPGYLLVQVQTAQASASKDPFGHKVARRLYKDMHALGLDHTAAWFSTATPNFYQAADTIGFIYQNHALTNNYQFNRFHWRVKEYPGLGEAMKYEPFRLFLFPTNQGTTNQFLGKLQRNVNFIAISHDRGVRALVTAACTQPDEASRQFADALGKIDWEDYRKFMSTGRSPLFDQGSSGGKPSIAGRWQLDVPATVLQLANSPDYGGGKNEDIQTRLAQFLRKATLRLIPNAVDGKPDWLHDFTIYFVNDKVDISGRFFPRKMVNVHNGPGGTSLNFRGGGYAKQPALLASGNWEPAAAEGKLKIQLTWGLEKRFQQEIGARHKNGKLHLSFPSLNGDTYIFNRYEY